MKKATFPIGKWFVPRKVAWVRRAFSQVNIFCLQRYNIPVAMCEYQEITCSCLVKRGRREYETRGFASWGVKSPNDYAESLSEAYNVLDRLPEAKWIPILWGRYLQYKTWEQIALETRQSVRNGMTLHKKALKWLEENTGNWPGVFLWASKGS